MRCCKLYCGDRSPSYYFQCWLWEHWVHIWVSSASWAAFLWTCSILPRARREHIPCSAPHTWKEGSPGSTWAVPLWNERMYKAHISSWSNSSLVLWYQRNYAWYAEELIHNFKWNFFHSYLRQSWLKDLTQELCAVRKTRSRSWKAVIQKYFLNTPLQSVLLIWKIFWVSPQNWYWEMMELLPVWNGISLEDFMLKMEVTRKL